MDKQEYFRKKNKVTSPAQAYNDFQGMRRYNVDGLDPHPISVTSLIKIIAPPTTLVKWFDKRIVGAALDAFEATGDIEKARSIGLEARWESSDEADLGTSIHYLCEVEDLKLLGRNIEPRTIADEKKLRSYVGQWVKTRDAHSMEILAAEVTLVNPELNYAGTADRICIIPSLSHNPVVLDLKSGSRIYPDVAMQCAALSRCTHIVHDDGSIGLIPWRLSSVFGVAAHVRPRSCRLYKLDITTAWQFFKFLPGLAKWKLEEVEVIGDEISPDEEQSRRAELRRKIAALPPDLADTLRGCIKNDVDLQGTTQTWDEDQLTKVENLFLPFEQQARERKQRIRDRYEHLESLDLSLKVLKASSGRTASIDELYGYEVDNLLGL